MKFIFCFFSPLLSQNQAFVVNYTLLVVVLLLLLLFYLC